MAGEKKQESSGVFSPGIVDHATNPSNAGSMDDADAYTSVLGTCGDNMEMWLRARDGRVEEVTFWTDDCGATIACGSMATGLAKCETLGEALAINAEVIAKSLGGLPDDHIHRAGLVSLTLKKVIIEYMNLEREPWKRGTFQDLAAVIHSHPGLNETIQRAAQSLYP